MTIERIILNKERNVTLDAWIQKTEGEFEKGGGRPAVFIIPGGGYEYCSDREAEPVAAAYVKAGFHAFILRYSVGKYFKWPLPLEDYEQAMELIHQRAKEWNVLMDKIAVLGFSAGGHLAATAATMAKNRPHAAILGYAVLTKEMAEWCKPGLPAPVELVDKNTCPCFLFAARDDDIVFVKDTVRFEEALIANDIMYESHIYMYGRHGFSTGEKFINSASMCSRVSRWVEDSIAWLKDVFGEMTVNGLTEPACKGRTNANLEETLSADCTLAHLMKQHGMAKQVLGDIFDKIHAMKEMPQYQNTDLDFMLNFLKLRDLQGIMGIPEVELERLDASLRHITNQVE